MAYTYAMGQGLDMGTICFFVEGPPRPQPRARTGKFGGRPYGVDTVTGWKAAFIAEASKHKPGQPLGCPLRVDLSFWFGRPKNHYRTGRHSDQLKPDAPGWAATKGRNDLDNLAKAVWDVMQSMGFIADDGLIVCSQLQKLYVGLNGNPGVAVQIEELE